MPPIPFRTKRLNRMLTADNAPIGLPPFVVRKPCPDRCVTARNSSLQFRPSRIVLGNLKHIIVDFSHLRANFRRRPRPVLDSASIQKSLMLGSDMSSPPDLHWCKRPRSYGKGRGTQNYPESPRTVRHTRGLQTTRATKGRRDGILAKGTKSPPRGGGLVLPARLAQRRTTRNGDARIRTDQEQSATAGRSVLSCSQTVLLDLLWRRRLTRTGHRATIERDDGQK